MPATETNAPGLETPEPVPMSDPGATIWRWMEAALPGYLGALHWVGDLMADVPERSFIGADTLRRI